MTFLNSTIPMTNTTDFMDHKNHFDIKYQEHFKLLVLFKDKIIFESELINRDISFYTEENQPLISGGIRYFLLDKDRFDINEILKNHAIIASTETINISDYRDVKKAYKLYLIFSILFIIIIVILSLI